MTQSTPNFARVIKILHMIIKSLFGYIALSYSGSFPKEEVWNETDVHQKNVSISSVYGFSISFLEPTLESTILVLNFGSPKYLTEDRVHMSLSQTMKTRKSLQFETSKMFVSSTLDVYIEVGSYYPILHRFLVVLISLKFITKQAIAFVCSLPDFSCLCRKKIQKKYSSKNHV